MNPGFVNLHPDGLLLRTRDGRNSVFYEPLYFLAKDGMLYRGPAGATTDWASTPRFGWDLLPPFGVYALAAGLHDCAYRGTLEKSIIQNPLSIDVPWIKANLTKEQCDDLLLEAMLSLGTSLVEREAIYNGVKYGGWKAFRDDRAAANPT